VYDLESAGTLLCKNGRLLIKSKHLRRAHA